MAKRTHKLRGLKDIARVVASAESQVAAAKQLGVNPSTLYRWRKAGKVPEPSKGSIVAAAPGQSPDEWAAAVRASGEWDATRSALVDLAVTALRMSHDEKAPHSTRLVAMGRYQQLVRHLNLTAEIPAESGRPPVRTSAPRAARTGSDPRAFLLAMK